MLLGEDECGLGSDTESCESSAMQLSGNVLNTAANFPKPSTFNFLCLESILGPIKGKFLELFVNWPFKIITYATAS